MSSPPVTSHPVGYLVKRLQQALRAGMDGALRTLDLTTPQYAALTALEEVPGASGAAVARYCFVTPQTMNEIVGNLLNAGLIRRAPHPENARILQMFLTEEGRTLLAQAHSLVQAVEARMVAPLAPEERAQLAAWLAACAAALEEDAP